VSALVLAASPLPAFAANVPLTLSSAAGPANGGNTITAQSTTTQAFLTGITAPAATFNIGTCPLTYNSTPTGTTTATAAANILAPSVSKLSNSKAAVTVPAGVILNTGTGVVSTRYNLCIYAGNANGSSPIAGNAAYTVATAPTVTSVSPANGPAVGGSLITVNGTNFPTTAGSITATLGGLPLTSVTPVNATSFTAIAPAQSPGAKTLSVTTAAGTQTLATAYEYENGISITPNTAPNTSTGVFLDILGAGFNNYDFAVAGEARVWLVDGTYDPDDGGAAAYTNGPVARCTGVVRVSDNEIICSLNLATGQLVSTDASTIVSDPAAPGGDPATVPNGTYTVTVVNLGDPGVSDDDDYLVSDLSSGSTFTVAPY
jgi:hypothetical protein